MLFDLEEGRFVGERLSEGWFVDALKVDGTFIRIDTIEFWDAATKTSDFV